MKKIFVCLLFFLCYAHSAEACDYLSGDPVSLLVNEFKKSTTGRETQITIKIRTESFGFTDREQACRHHRLMVDVLKKDFGWQDYYPHFRKLFLIANPYQELATINFYFRYMEGLPDDVKMRMDSGSLLVHHYLGEKDDRWNYRKFRGKHGNQKDLEEFFRKKVGERIFKLIENHGYYHD